MLQECDNGTIDRILVKSVSRFARNTVDLLHTVRKLKMQGISVWFEEQQLDSLSQEGEMLLTLIASVAQTESESLSQNIKWAVRAGFQQGKGNTRRRMFGYRWENGEMVVVPSEADIVRRIYTKFLEGVSCKKITEQLNEQGIRSVNGNRMSMSAVSFILRNITYTGNLLLQKTYVQDPLTKKKKINNGELPQYFVENNHEAIITMEIFEKVQKKLEENRKMQKFPYNRTGETYPFTGKIICGICGRHYTRQVWNTAKNGKRSPTWVCTGKKNEKYRWCTAKNISERKLMEACAEMLGTEQFDESLFEQKVDHIVIGGDGKPLFSVIT